WFFECDTNCVAPLSRAHFPTQHDALATILVIGLQYQMLAVFFNEAQQVDLHAAELSAAVAHAARPGNVRLDGVQLRRLEHRRVSLVTKHGKAQLLVQYLAAERVHHAHCAVAHRTYDRMIDATALDELADQYTLVDQVDRHTLYVQPSVAIVDFARIANH